MSTFDSEPIETGIVEAFAYHTNASKTTMPPPLGGFAQSSAAQQPGQAKHVSNTLKAAETYIRAGWRTFPGKRGNHDQRDKQPMAGWLWKKTQLTLADAPKYFDADQHNVLIALGDSSRNLVDIDLDWHEAAAAAEVIFDDLPSFGRSGKPRSHRLATCSDIKSKKFLLPQSLADHPKVAGQQDHQMCIAEIRGGGSYTVFPGSEHQTGQKVEWTDAASDNVASIPAIEAGVLRKKMGLLSFTSFCMRVFPPAGVRCDFMMAVAGALARAGYGADMIQRIVQSIGVFNGDEGDNEAWRVASDSVAGKLKEGEEVTGLPTLVKILGLDDAVLKWCRDMLGTKADVTGGRWPDGQHDENKPKRGILNTIEAIARGGIKCTWDDFRKKEYWFGHDHKSFDGEVSDAAVTVARRNLHKGFGLYPTAEQMREAITCACRDNMTNPVLDYFSGLRWDGQPRLDKMLHKILGANDTPLNTAFGVKMMCAAVRRAKHPGCKFDHQLVLQGGQGVRKSMFCEDLAVFPDLFTDAGDLSADIKQQMEVGLGKQIIEFPEHAGHSRAMRDKNKANLTRKVDRARMAYAHYASDTPRQWVAIATVNPGGYLNDPTGERRYWHVSATSYNRDVFLAQKDQIYAEAVAREPHEKLWLDTPELQAAHDALVATVKEPNELVDQLANLRGEVWTVNGGKEERISVAEIGGTLGLMGVDRVRIHGLGRRIAEAMMELKWEKAPGTIRCHKGQDPVTGYRRPLVDENAASHTEQPSTGTSPANACKSAAQDAPAEAPGAESASAFIQRLAKTPVVDEADLERIRRGIV
jgi:virulence-associated protein E/bifunctional DNA primase/polymerase-like protein